MTTLNLYISRETGQVISDFEKAYYFNEYLHKLNINPLSFNFYKIETNPKEIASHLEMVYHNIENNKEYANYLLSHKPILKGYINYLKEKYSA